MMFLKMVAVGAAAVLAADFAEKQSASVTANALGQKAIKFGAAGVVVYLGHRFLAT